MEPDVLHVILCESVQTNPNNLHRCNVLGLIKITNVEPIQDGVIRLYYKAGPMALADIQKQEALIEDACAKFACSKTELLSAIERLQGEWKERGKQVEKLTEQLAETLVKEKIEHAKRHPDDVVKLEKTAFTAAQLNMIAGKFKEHALAAILTNTDGNVVCVGNVKHNALDLLKSTGAKGGGKPDFAQGKIA